MKRGLILISIFLLVISMFIVSAGCDGTATSCGSYGTQLDCEGQSGCIWNPAGPECNGGAVPCNLFSTLESCIAQSGCGWVELGPPPLPGNDDVILAISSTTNAHGEVYDYSSYGYLIEYSEIFGVPYSGTPTRDLVPAEGAERPAPNWVVALSADTNAHAQTPNLAATYPTHIYYGDLACIAYEGPCSTLNLDPSHDFRCVVTLSGDSNAHLAKCGIAGSYDYKICCTSPSASGEEEVNCQDYTDRDSCINTDQCTWTPHLEERIELDNPYDKNPQPGSGIWSAGCCPRGETPDKDQEWKIVDQMCGQTASICTTIFLNKFESIGPRDSGYGPAIDVSNGWYCAQITSDLSYGFWTPIETY